MEPQVFHSVEDQNEIYSKISIYSKRINQPIVPYAKWILHVALTAIVISTA